MKQEPPPTGTEGTSGRIFIVAGELSGDQHAAGMLGALLSGPEETRPSQVAGLGGSRMQALCPEVEDWLEQAAVLGLVEVLKKYGWFRDKMAETVTRILEGSFDGVVLVDYPGFNLRLAQRLRDKGYRGKLIYYISPQVWAWKRGRVKTMARLLDGMICIFPFEKEFYDDSGLPTQFSGHPLVDALAPKRLPQGAREAGLVALLPGSREREIAALFPAMLDVCIAWALPVRRFVAGFFSCHGYPGLNPPSTVEIGFIRDVTASQIGVLRLLLNERSAINKAIEAEARP